MKKILLIAALSLTAGAANAATTFVFKGDGLNVTPQNAFVQDCGTVGTDFCSTGDHTGGLEYTLDGIVVTAKAYANDMATRIIQDVSPTDSGLGAFSESNPDDDQTQADSNEAIEFIFDDEYTVTDVEFNAGGDVNCTTNAGGAGEGPCGSFRLDIYAGDLTTLVSSSVIDITNIDLLPVLGTGARFVLTALTAGAGFTVAQLTINEVPIPGAIPLLISGLAGLGFASRKKKTA